MSKGGELSRQSGPAAPLLSAIDEAVALNELLTLTFYAGEGMGDTQGAATARAALMAQDKLLVVRELMDQALQLLGGKDRGV